MSDWMERYLQGVNDAAQGNLPYGSGDKKPKHVAPKRPRAERMANFLMGITDTLNPKSAHNMGSPEVIEPITPERTPLQLLESAKSMSEITPELIQAAIMDLKPGSPDAVLEATIIFDFASTGLMLNPDSEDWAVASERAGKVLHARMIARR